MNKKHIQIEPERLLERKFCSFVVSNGFNCDKEREIFFKLLNTYKKIDSGGRFLNNIGYRVYDK